MEGNGESALSLEGPASGMVEVPVLPEIFYNTISFPQLYLTLCHH